MLRRAWIGLVVLMLCGAAVAPVDSAPHFPFPKKHKRAPKPEPAVKPAPAPDRPATGATVPLDLRVDLSQATHVDASAALRPGLTAYQHEEIPRFVWDRILSEQRLGDVLIEPKWTVILPSRDLQDLKERMKSLDGLVTDIVRAGGRVLLGFQGVPRWNSSQPGNEQKLLGNQNEKIWYSVPPKDYAQWQEIVRAFVQHFNKELDTRGAVSYMIGSEPENYWKGTEAEFYKYYEASVRGARQADPGAKIGGITPSFHLHDRFNSTGTPTRGGRPLLYNWIQYCASNRLPIDFVTWHSYPAGSPVPPDATMWGLAARDIRKWLREAGFRDTRLIVTDWPEWKTHPESDTAFKAAWVASGFLSLIRSGIDGMTYLAVRDTGLDKEAAGRNGSFGGGNGLFTKMGVVKPVYNTLLQISRMEGKLVPVETQDEFVSGLASVKEGKVFLLLSYFIPPDWLLSRTLLDPAVDVAAIEKEMQSSGMKKGALEQLVKNVMNGSQNVESLSFSGPTKSYFRALAALSRKARERSGSPTAVRVAIRGIGAGTWSAEDYVVDESHGDLSAQRGAIQAKLSPFYNSRDERAASAAVQEINSRAALAAVPMNVAAGGAGSPEVTLQAVLNPYAVHLIVLTQRR